MKDLFIGFLKQYGAEEGYRRMAQERVDKSVVFKEVDDYLNFTSPDSFICAVYSWDKTEEGHSYWSNVNKKWRKELLKQTNEKTN